MYDGHSGVESGDYVTITGNVISYSGLSGMYLKSGKYVTVSGNLITNSGDDGIVVKIKGPMQYVAVTGNTIKQAIGSGIHIGDGLSDGVIQGNIITSPTVSGIAAEASQNNLTIAQNEIYYPTTDGIRIEGGKGLLVNSNLIRMSDSNHGIVIRNVVHFVATGNMVLGSGTGGESAIDDGILAWSSSFGVVSSNMILGNATNGIHLYNSVTNVTITGNVVSTASNCIREEGGSSDFNIISNNIVDRCSSKDVSFVGTHDLVKDNRGYGQNATIDIGAPLNGNEDTDGIQSSSLLLWNSIRHMLWAKESITSPFLPYWYDRDIGT